MEFNTDIFAQFNDQWALLTAGTPEDYNTMTVSWGGLGTLWGRPVATVYVRPSRYTYTYMENCDTFTLSFYPEALRPALEYCGSHSGREGDKAKAAGLEAVPAGEGVTFRGAEKTLVCKKLYAQAMDPAAMPEQVRNRLYKDGGVHKLYIGEVLEVL